jgi:hypothetical protein
MLKAILLLTVVNATGDPTFAPSVIGQADMATCQAAAKAAVEAFAAAHDERAMPSRLAGSTFAAVKDDAGAWVIRYQRQSRTDPKVGEPATARMVRAACREATP